MTILSIGSGWFFSSIARNETAAAGLAMLSTAATGIAIAMVLRKLQLDTLGATPYSVVSFSMGAAGLIAGTLVALLRKTP
jgi:tetrahydromethanopterin S-methyltransferase subunit F